MRSGPPGCLAALAIFTYFHNVPQGPPVKATAADFAAGRVHDGEYLELAAATAGNALRLKRSGDERLYIPLAEAPVVVSIDAGDTAACVRGSDSRLAALNRR